MKKKIEIFRNETHLSSFLFTTAYHGENLKDWYERTKLLKTWRSIVDRYPSLNATVFNDEGIYFDLIDNMPTDAWQSGLAVLSCMVIICAVFMLDVRAVLVISMIIASIIAGTLGSLSWEGISMDPIVFSKKG